MTEGNLDASYSSLSSTVKAKEKRTSRRRPVQTESTDDGVSKVSELFEEVPASERRVEKPIWCTYGKRVGNLHITRNYLCWGGMGESFVVHFGEIIELEKGGMIFDSIEIKSKVRATSKCASEALHDFGPGISKCVSCGASPCWNRGCKKCNIRLCERCFTSHKEAVNDELIVRYVIKPRDLDRVYSILYSLWKAHLRIPVEKRQGRFDASSASIVQKPASDDSSSDVEGRQGKAASEEDLIRRLKYAPMVSEDMFSAPSVPRNNQTPGLYDAHSPLSKVYKLLISSNSTFIKDYHNLRKDEHFEHANWTHSDDGKASGTRLITFFTKTPLGKKKMFEAQRYWWTEDRITLHCSSQAPDITFGSSFRTETLFDFKCTDGKVTITACSHVLFLKSVGLMGSTIKKTAGKNCDEANAILCQEAVRVLRRDAGEDDAEAPSQAAAPPPPENKSLIVRCWDIAIAWCTITLCLCVAAIAVIATAPSASPVTLNLPPLAYTTVEIHNLAAASKGFVSKLPSQELLAAIGISEEEALPLLYDLLAKEVLRTQWIQLLSTVSCALGAAAFVLWLVKKLFATIPS
eukprot:TRINITY_DN2808_c0_g1_i1.p1 TRINITY_DN2808_c0_g1~~TRINITY_DN2808_c0_g1_i1.p1  ORF type:complete len:577 (+),score=170.22 TRINITY_DN2808_c0_g1_i1:1527-3257(+)